MSDPVPQTPTDLNLHDALALNSPEACQDYYRAWAVSYDSDFAAPMAYLLPAHVAAAYRTAGGGGPVLDVGAGTGLLAERLREMGFADQIDAVDFSAEMLAQAAAKGIYGTLTQADITRPLPLPRRYAGVVSSGTFTSGHVGPEALPMLLDVALPGALFALSVNRRVWAAQGFDRAFLALEAAGRLTDLHRLEVQIYGKAERHDPEHAATTAQDRAEIVLFRSV